MAEIQTVTGPIDSSQLDLTLMHEHIFIDRTAFWEEPPENQKDFAYHPIKMNILGDLRIRPFENKENGLMLEEDVAIKELKFFSDMGGKTIVDVTINGIGRDPNKLKRVSEATGLQVVMGSGYYLEPSHPSDLKDKTIDNIKQEIVTDLTVGVDGSDIKAGIIGEIGISPAMSEQEVKVLRAAARAQAETGNVLTIHLPGWERYAHRVLDIVAEEGGAIEKTILDHMNPSMYDLDYQWSLADRGCYLEYDMIGIDLTFPEGQSPSDEENAKAIVGLLEKGYGSQLLLSQDVFLKILLKTYGGKGYAHILKNFVPLLKQNGVSQDQINQMLIQNPREVFEKEVR